MEHHDCCCGRRQDRRGLLRLLCGATLALALLPARALAKKVAVKLDALPALKKVGGFVVAKVKGRKILLVRDGEDSVRGYTPKCSHQAYRLTYDAKTRQLVCPNHGSRFDLAGKPLKGPAKKPLSEVYRTHLDRPKGRVIIKLD
jgi:Rieske Fe-S protein